MRCSPELSTAAGQYLRSVLGAGAVAEFRAWFPFNSEDFALFLSQVSGAMFFLGAADPPAGINALPHVPDLAADERAITIATRAMAGWLTRRLRALSTP
jgi:metal-dependent amidase/aminoacylase/carboxypeptidase family protein